MDREPEPWQTDQPGPCVTIGAVSVWALGGDRFRVEAPERSREIEGFDEARMLARQWAGR
jgi:hypothetical protein